MANRKKLLDTASESVVINSLDKNTVIVLAIPDVATINRARKWILGAAKLLADASNGCPMVERIACEASTLALMAEVVALEYSEDTGAQLSSREVGFFFGLVS